MQTNREKIKQELSSGCQLKGRNGVTVNTWIINNVSDEGKMQEWLAVTAYEIGVSVKIAWRKKT